MATAITYFLRFLDTLFGIGAFVSIIKILNAFQNGYGFDSLKSATGIVQLIFGVIGIVYLIFRLHHFYHDSKLSRDLKREDLRERIHKNREITKEEAA